MDQKELRELESRCIEENPPRCTAACPLHVDARSLCAALSKGDWAGGWKVLLRSMPLPGVLGRICDAPCQKACKRSEAGEPIAVNELERALVRHPPPRRVAAPLPGRPDRIAIVGAGLAGLTAAWDLARKGYGVTVYEPGASLAADLQNSLAHRVPERVFADELALLSKLGLVFELEAKVYQSGFMDCCLAEHQAVILSLDALKGGAWPLDYDAEGKPEIDSPLQATKREGVFAAGRGGPKGASPVWRAAEGRWAALSADRFLQGVSSLAGRENDIPYQSRLYTSLKGVEPLPVVEAEGGIYSDQEAAQEARRCLQCHCLECVKVCPYLESYGAYPKKYTREIYNNQSIVMGARLANKLINSCSLCGLCEEVCPESFAMHDLCLDARREMVEKNKMPPSAHEFALMDMEFSLGPEFHLTRHQPGFERSAYVFYPGCQLAGSNPGQVITVYEYLCNCLAGGVGLMLSCCGAPAHWSGRREKFKEVLSAWRDEWLALGGPPVIMACSSCRDVFCRGLPEVEQISLWHVFKQSGLKISPGLKGPFALHDPCTTRHDPKVRQTVRDLLAGGGVRVEELELSGDRTECCGFGGLMENANPELAKEVITRRAGRSPLDYLAYCAVCRDRLASIGKRALHVLDLLFPQPGQGGQAMRPSPGWSQRRERRARLKAELLEKLWGEEPPRAEKEWMITLSMTPKVRELLEERRILDEDIRKVIQSAEQSGRKFTHPVTGRSLASFQPYNAVFWVEYSPAGRGYQVYNAYSHRMVIKPGATK